MTGWKTKELGELCEFQRGLTYGKSDEVDVSVNVVLRANNVHLATHTLDLSDLRYISDSVSVPANKKVRRGSLLICTASGSKSHLGKVAYVDEDYGYAFGGFMGQLTPAAGVDGRYLFHVLTSPAYKAFIEALSDGLNINNLKFDDLRQFPVALPGIEEQRRIVAILDEAFEAIAIAKANAEKNLWNSRELFESALDAALLRHDNGYVEATLGDEIELLAGYAFSSKGYTNAADGVRLLRGDNIMQGYLRWDDAKAWPANDVGPYARFALREGDVVLAMDRPWVKAGLKRAQIGVDDLPCLQVQRTARLRPTRGMSVSFLYHLTGSRSFSKHLLGLQTGLGVPHISGKQIESFRFMLPPHDAQRTIASTLDELEQESGRLADICQKKLAALDELKKSLLHQAFAGQLSAKAVEKKISEVV
jgi:type I restriction enzyme S subunit